MSRDCPTGLTVPNSLPAVATIQARAALGRVNKAVIIVAFAAAAVATSKFGRVLIKARWLAQ